MQSGPKVPSDQPEVHRCCNRPCRCEVLTAGLSGQFGEDTALEPLFDRLDADVLRAEMHWQPPQ
ncbi:MAG: hypothetical protein AAF218_09840 [Pseudomonadota bacterium]